MSYRQDRGWPLLTGFDSLLQLAYDNTYSSGRQLTMNKGRLGLCVMLVLATLLACRCAPHAGPSPSAPATQGDDNQPILTLTGPNASQTLTLAQIKAMPVTEGWAGIKTSVGTIVKPARYKGVSIIDLCNLIGGLGADSALEIVAEDGYAMTMSQNQAANGKFVTYDPVTGDEIPYGEALQVVIAYESDGKPLPQDTDGTLRLVIISSKNDQITDGHWSVKWVKQLIVKRVREWTLHLEGYLMEDLDRRSFEEGAAACCHHRLLVDAEGNAWAGVPLWRLVGLVDDEVRHQVLAFNATLAEQGYQIDVVGADGYTVSLDSKRVMYNIDIVVANSMNDQELDDKYFPLRLVGAGLEKSEMVGQVAKIVVHVPGPTGTAQPLPTVTVAPSKPLATPTGGGLFTLTGKVQREVVITADDIRQMEVTVEGHHFTGTLGTYTGARLSELLQHAGPTADARYMVLTSVDGGEAQMPLALLATCPNCVIGLDESGQATAYMPEMDCYFWMRQLIELDIR
jgi:DMSO/TMAO reductase YedYZ molybdopterin-dependent catalytic subunit